jgi:hypothetical protein
MQEQEKNEQRAAKEAEIEETKTVAKTRKGKKKAVVNENKNQELEE